MYIRMYKYMYIYIDIFIYMYIFMNTYIKNSYIYIYENRLWCLLLLVIDRQNCFCMEIHISILIHKRIYVHEDIDMHIHVYPYLF
jgi:hypothetical protein